MQMNVIKYELFCNFFWTVFGLFDFPHITKRQLQILMNSTIHQSLKCNPKFVLFVWFSTFMYSFFHSKEFHLLIDEFKLVFGYDLKWFVNSFERCGLTRRKEKKPANFWRETKKSEKWLFRKFHMKLFLVGNDYACKCLWVQTSALSVFHHCIY